MVDTRKINRKTNRKPNRNAQKKRRQTRNRTRKFNNGGVNLKPVVKFFQGIGPGLRKMVVNYGNKIKDKWNEQKEDEFIKAVNGKIQKVVTIINTKREKEKIEEKRIGNIANLEPIVHFGACLKPDITTEDKGKYYIFVFFNGANDLKYSLVFGKIHDLPNESIESAKMSKTIEILIRKKDKPRIFENHEVLIFDVFNFLETPNKGIHSSISEKYSEAVKINFIPQHSSLSMKQKFSRSRSV